MNSAGLGLSQMHGLLNNHAIFAALMEENSWSNLASAAADFDRGPRLTRYASV